MKKKKLIKVEISSEFFSDHDHVDWICSRIAKYSSKDGTTRVYFDSDRLDSKDEWKLLPRMLRQDIRDFLKDHKGRTRVKYIVRGRWSWKIYAVFSNENIATIFRMKYL